MARPPVHPAAWWDDLLDGQLHVLQGYPGYGRFDWFDAAVRRQAAQRRTPVRVRRLLHGQVGVQAYGTGGRPDGPSL